MNQYQRPSLYDILKLPDTFSFNTVDNCQTTSLNDTQNGQLQGYSKPFLSPHDGDPFILESKAAKLPQEASLGSGLYSTSAGPQDDMLFEPSPSIATSDNSVSSCDTFSTAGSRDVINSPRADPKFQSTASRSGAPKRALKHPSKFQCTTCPKRYTRGHILRVHMRTHTEEQVKFVCSVCAKAFARKSNWARHEGLHSSEKMFICKGGQKDGVQWGCGRH